MARKAKTKKKSKTLPKMHRMANGMMMSDEEMDKAHKQPVATRKKPKKKGGGKRG